MALNKWEDVNREILELIIPGLGFEDFDAFRCVCTWWRSLAREEVRNLHLRKLPWLMLAEREGMESREFFIFSQRKIRQLLVPELKGRKCLSSLGLIMAIDQRGVVELIDPFGALTATIKLPSLDLFRSEEDSGVDFYPNYVTKFALSANPISSADYAVMILADSKAELGFWRPGNERWAIVESTTSANFDVLYYKGRFVIIDCSGSILVCDLEDGRPAPVKAEVVLEMPQGLLRNVYMEEIYLVELKGKLLVVSREGSVTFDSIDEARTYGFQVFEADLEAGTWTEVHSLGDSSLFIGYNSSFSLRIQGAYNTWVKPNCIYFTDDYFPAYNCTENGGGKDMGIYHMEDARVERHYKGQSLCFITPPLWLEPSC